MDDKIQSIDINCSKERKIDTNKNRYISRMVDARM